MLLLPAAAQATTYYAKPNTSNTTGCTTPQTACAINYAIGTAPQQNGDQVVVLPGTYNAGASTIVASKAISIHGQAGSPMPEIDGTTQESGNNYALLQLAGGPGTSVSDLKLVQSGNFGPPAVLFDEGGGAKLDRLFAETTGGATGEGVILRNGDVLKDSVVWVSSQAPAVSAISGSVRVENVTAEGEVGVAANPGPGGSVSATVQNTIAHGSVYDVGALVPPMGGTVSLTASYSNYQTTSGTVIDGGHNQTQPPVLADQANGNFHELPSSPTVNAGIASSFIGSRDLDGNPRNQGGAPDIGAFELPAPTATTGPAHVVGKTATLTGKVNPAGGKVTSCRFSYGPTTSYGSSVPCAQTVGSGTAAVAVSARVTKLRPGTTYHYRLVVVDAGKTVRGSDARFTTPSRPAASVPPSLSATPRAGKPVTCRPGSWTGSPTFAFAWLLGGRTIAGAHEASFTPPKADIGQALQCQVTATNGAGSTHADSAAKVVKK